MGSSLDFQPEVYQDIDCAITWYEMCQTGSGQRFLTEVKYTLSKITRNPRYIYHDSQEHTLCGIECFPIHHILHYSRGFYCSNYPHAQE